MSEQPQRSHRARAALAVVAGLLWAAAYPPVHLGVMATFLTLPILLSALHGATYRSAAFYGYLFGLAGYGAGCSWIFLVFGPSGTPLILLIALSTLLFGVCARLLLARPTALRLAATAVMWTAIEFLRAETGPLRNATLVFGFSVPDSLLPLASIVGVYGLSLLIALPACLLYGAVYGSPFQRSRLAVTVFVLCALPVGLAMSLVGKELTQSKARQIEVLAVQAERVPIERLLALSEAGLAKGPKVDLVVWPEYAVGPSFIEEDAIVRRKIADFCRRHGLHLLFGNKRRAKGNEFFNTAFLMGPKGKLVGSAQKSRPVPFLNDGLPTNGPAPIPSPFGLIGVPICYDADFSLVTRGIAAQGAQALIAPTRDNRHWGWFQHVQRAHMIRLRGAETGRQVLRLNSSGPSVLIGAQGRFRERLWLPAEDSFRVKLTFSAPQSPPSFYVSRGWLIGPGLVLLAATLLLWGIISRPGPSLKRP